MNVQRDQNPSSHICAGFHKQTQVKYQMCILTWIEQLAEHQVKNKKKRKLKPKKGKKVCSIEMLD